MNPSGGTVADFVSILKAIQSDARYLKNLDWGKLRAGHPEGTVRAHIEELEGNLARLRPHVSEEQADKLRVLIHVHDTFKAEALSGVAIADPRSHASIARAFLAEFCDDADLLAMVQNHDEPYALWKQHANKGRLAVRGGQRLEAVYRISDHRCVHERQGPRADSMVADFRRGPRTQRVYGGGCAGLRLQVSNFKFEI